MYQSMPTLMFLVSIYDKPNEDYLSVTSQSPAAFKSDGSSFPKEA